MPSVTPVAVAVTVAVPAVVVDCKAIVASPSDGVAGFVPINAPVLFTLNVTEFVAVITGLSQSSFKVTVIKLVLVPSAIILLNSAVQTILVAGLLVLTSTVPEVKPVPAAVTVAIPGVVVDCNFTVASPATAALIDVSSNVPSPLTENTITFAAVVIGLSPSSHIAAVINDVDEPSAVMLVGAAVFMSFAGARVVVTFTVPSLKPAAVALTAAVPGAAVDCNVIVDIPPDASFVSVPNRVPSPVTENVSVFVAVVTGLFPESHIVAVINDVDEPSAAIVVGSAVFMSFAGPTVVVNTFTVPSLKPAAVELTVAVPAVVVDRNFTVASPSIAALVVVSNNVP